MRLRFIGVVVVLVAIATMIGVEAQQRERTYRHRDGETCHWSLRRSERGVLMKYNGLYGRIYVQASDDPAYAWFVVSESGTRIASGSTGTAREALEDLCGGLIRIFATGVPESLRPEDAYRQLLEELGR